MKQELEQTIKSVCKNLFGADVEPQLTRTSEQFGDYATNVALQLAKQLNKNSREVAQAIVEKLQSPDIAKAEVAGPGFINLTLTDEALTKLAQAQPTQNLAGKTIVAEFSDPNPFKVLHAGHLYTSIVGEGIARLLEVAGATVHRVNFGGDVGLHVGRTMWAILKTLGGEHPEKLAEIPEAERSEWMAKAYVEGTNAYEDDEQAKAEIIALNKRVYQLHTDNDHDSSFAHIYWTCRQWSYDYFDEFYARIGSHFEKYYPESQTVALGLEAVNEQLEKGVYERSDGAIIFNGEKYGLHTRVFINSEGLPTYEAKDVGVLLAKWRDYHPDKSLIITGNDIAEYMKVVLKSVEQFLPELSNSTTHITHGNVKLMGGVKMSSRKGNVLRAVDILDAAAEANQKVAGKDDNRVVLGAVKYAFLKNRIGADVIYDPVESVSLQGNSGPYLQYAHARARSILEKATVNSQQSTVTGLEAGERSLVRKIGEYPEVVNTAVAELMPHYVCTYLYELAQVFNRFYENSHVIGDPREAIRVQLVQSYAQTLKNGLELLNITAPERM